MALDYLVAIYNLTVEGDSIPGARLAQKFQVSPASVSERLKRLQRDGYVSVDHARRTVLTAQGIREAESSLRTHRVAECFLFTALGMDWVVAHSEAEALQHALTPAIEARMMAVLGNPVACPHGNPIPGCGANTAEYLRSHDALRLSTVAVDTAVYVLSISEVVEDETSLLRYLDESGLHPGVLLAVRRPRA